MLQPIGQQPRVRCAYPGYGYRNPDSSKLGRWLPSAKVKQASSPLPCAQRRGGLGRGAPGSKPSAHAIPASRLKAPPQTCVTSNVAGASAAHPGIGDLEMLQPIGQQPRVRCAYPGYGYRNPDSSKLGRWLPSAKVKQASSPLPCAQRRGGLGRGAPGSKPSAHAIPASRLKAPPQTCITSNLARVSAAHPGIGDLEILQPIGQQTRVRCAYPGYVHSYGVAMAGEYGPCPRNRSSTPAG